MSTYNIGFINPEGKEDETQFDAFLKEELTELWWDFCKENGIITYVEEEEDD
jgi:hypothetical protein